MRALNIYLNFGIPCIGGFRSKANLGITVDIVRQVGKDIEKCRLHSGFKGLKLHCTVNVSLMKKYSRAHGNEHI